VDLITEGFEGQGRLLRLLAAALKDLRGKVLGLIGNPSGLSLYLSCPNPYRIWSNIELIVDEDSRERTRAQSPGVLLGDGSDAVQALVFRAAELAKWPGRIQVRAVATSGHTGMIEVTDLCLEDMASGRVEQAIVGAVDSLLDEDTLAWLSKTGRLKNPALPAGLMPGEAAALLLLSSRRNRRDTLGSIEVAALESEDRSFERGQPPRGCGLSGVILKIAQLTGWPGQDVPWFLSDQNGETFRAGDWGCALQRLTRTNHAFLNARVWFPVVSFGDTAGASAGVAAGCALAAWKRGYAVSDRCCIVSCSDGTARAGLLMGNLQ
jgi:3-oxoacyl-[acyl-carrier-protein] synthase-1